MDSFLKIHNHVLPPSLCQFLLLLYVVLEDVPKAAVLWQWRFHESSVKGAFERAGVPYPPGDSFMQVISHPRWFVMEKKRNVKCRSRK